jgi:hypothetical protein
MVALKCRYRSLLPAGHALVDLVLVCYWIWHAVVVLNPLITEQHKHAISPMAAYAAPESIGWDPSVYSHTEPYFAVMLTGTLPAGMVSATLRPEAGWQTRNRLWDPVWVLYHEMVAIPFWILLGFLLDARPSWVGKLMRGYLGSRVVVMVLAMAFPTGNWWIPQFLFWMAIGAYLFVLGFQWMRGRAATTRGIPAKSGTTRRSCHDASNPVT